MGADIVGWSVWIIDGLMLTSHGIIAAMVAMILGRVARWDRHRLAEMDATRPTSQ